MNNQTEKTVQNCAPSSPSRGGKSRPVMAINRVFMTSIDDIKKEQDHRIRKNLGKSRGLAESDSPVRVEHAEDIKVKVEVETNNNILLAGEDGIPLQDREEPSGAEGDDDCEDFAAIQDRPVEDHEDIQVKVFTRSRQSPATAPVKFDCPTPHNVESPDGVPVSPVDDVIVISDSTDSESLEVRKKSKQKHRRKTSLCKENLTIRSPNRQISMAESTSRKCRRRHSKSRDQSKSPSRHSSSSRSSRRHRKSSTSWGDEESPHSRDSSSRRSGSSRTPSRESPTIDLRKRSRSRDSSRIALRDQSESPKRDIKRGHRSRTPQRISKYDKSSEEREVDATCFQEERKDSSLKSNKPKGTVLKGTDRGSLPPQSMSCDVANIPLPPLTKLSSSEQYVDAVESTSEDEMVDNDHKTSVSWDSSKRDISFNKSILKNNSLYNSPQARPTQHNSFIFSPPGHYYHNLPYASSVPPPHHFMYPQDFSTPPPSMSRGIFEWSTASNSFAHAQSPSQMSVHEPRPVPSQSPAATSISSPPITEVDRKFQRLQNLHTPPKPNFYGYQLIGDSMFLRFSQQLLNENAIIAESLRFLGYCVSGQRIGDLLKRLKSGFYHVGKKVIVMIGTNDLLRSTPAQQMRYELKKVIEHLKQSMTENIVILTLPPVPRLQNQTYHWQRLQEYNNYITSLADKGRPLITPVDICKLFVDHRIPKCRLDCFELTFSDNGRKDLIHLNKKGLTMVQDELYKIL